MDENLLLQFINEGLSHIEIAKKTNVSKGSVAYWLKKYKLKTNNKQFSKTGKKGFRICFLCKDEKEIKTFYSKSGYCKDCFSDYRKKKIFSKKVELINYKGGECVKCNLKLCDSHPSVFEFHHTDPKQKDPNYSSNIRFANIEKAKKELDKCVLVCANCHRLIHYS